MDTIKKMANAVSEAATTAVDNATGIQHGHMTRMNGCPIGHMKHSLTAGPLGPIVLQDGVLIEKLTQFDREKIPARNVHALGTGAHGYFQLTKDMSQYTCADIFSKVGHKTELFARLSGTFTEQGDPETLRDIRGFAMKMYTTQGNWDLMCINTPVFAVRDALPGPDAVHACKRDIRNSMWNPTQFWDYVATHPEGLHQTTMLYTDRGGCPMSFRHMDAYGCNTYSFWNKNKERVWIKFHVISTLGVKGLNQRQAKLVAGEDPNFLTRDLLQAIERGDYPRWKLCVQIMNEEEGYRRPETFDCTKVWKHDEFPLIEVGEIVLNKNIVDYFTEVEQVAFSPANTIPGIGYSPDRLLQGRLLIYDDTQHHRLGPNHKQIPINFPKNCPPKTNFMSGGQHQMQYMTRWPHYYPSTFGGLKPYGPEYEEPPMRASGPVGHYDWPKEGTDWDYYGQTGDFYRTLIPEDRDHLCENIAVSLEKVPEHICTMMIQSFSKCDMEYGRMVEEKLRLRKEGKAERTEAEILVQQLDAMLKGKLSEEHVMKK